MKVTDASSIAAVQPGGLVNAMVLDRTDKGLELQVLGLFQGSIHSLHLPEDWRTSKAFKEGKKVMS